MAVARGNNSGSHAFTNVTVVTFAHTVGASAGYIRAAFGVIDAIDLSMTASSATYAGTSMASVGVSNRNPQTGGDGSRGSRAQIFELINPSTGANNVVIVFQSGAGNNYGCAGSADYTGVNQSVASGTAVASNGSGTAINDVVASNAGDMISDAVYFRGGDASTGGTPAFSVGANSFGFTSGPNHFYFGGTQDTANSGNVSMAWTAPVSSDWAHVAAQIIAAATGIAFDAAANSGDKLASSSYTFNRTITGANTFLAVDVSILSAGQSITSISDDSAGGAVPMVFIGSRATVTALGSVECWGLAGAVTGTKSIQVNLSGSVESVATAVSYTGVHQTVPTEAFNSAQATNSGSATDASVAITTIADNDWVHAALVTDDLSVTANQTSRNNVSGTLGSGANEDNNAAKTPAGSVTMSYTGEGITATWAIAGYAIRPLAAPGASVMAPYYHRHVAGLG